MKKIHTDKAPAAVGPYSQAVEINGIVYTSGQIALDPATGELVGETIEEQVVELGARKKALFERLITPGETVLSAMTEKEIRSLFQ